MSRTELVVPVDIDAPAATVWDVVTDWAAQGEWILGTRVTVQDPDGARRLGGRFAAFTGVGPVGFTDPMEVVEWDPPRRCVVAHLGRVVRGDGVFEVTELGPARSRFLWTERLELPLGARRPARLAAGPPGLPAGRRAVAAPAGPDLRGPVPGRAAGEARR